MEQIKEMHRHLLGEELTFSNGVVQLGLSGENFSISKKKQCSDGIGNDDQLSYSQNLIENISIKSRPKKAPRKELTKNSQSCILASFIYLFNYLRELKNEAKITLKGVVFRDIRCSFPRKGVVFRDMRCSFSRHKKGLCNVR